MINTILRHKKLARKRKLRNRLERNNNISKNLRMQPEEYEVPILRSVTHDVKVGYPSRIERQQLFDEKGKPIVEKVGMRTKIRRMRKSTKGLPSLYLSKKYRLGKKEIQRRKVVIGNIIKTATSH